MSAETGETGAKAETGGWSYNLTLAAIMALFSAALSIMYWLESGGLDISGHGGKLFENFVFIVQQIILVLVPIFAVYGIVAHIDRPRQGFIPAAVDALFYLAVYVLALCAVFMAVIEIVSEIHWPCEDVECLYLGIWAYCVFIMVMSVLAPIYSWLFLKWRRNYWKRKKAHRLMPPAEAGESA